MYYFYKQKKKKEGNILPIFFLNDLNITWRALAPHSPRTLFSWGCWESRDFNQWKVLRSLGERPWKAVLTRLVTKAKLEPATLSRLAGNQMILHTHSATTILQIHQMVQQWGLPGLGK